MSDISKCFGKNCNKKDSCFRYLATASEYQPYILIENPGKCSMYWEATPETLPDLQKAWDD